MTHDLSRYDPVWRAAEPYMRARKNDVHIPLSFDWAVRLLDHFPQADRDVCLLAILLHDIGWWAIDMETIIDRGLPVARTSCNPTCATGTRPKACGWPPTSCAQTGWTEAIIAQVCEIIDGHDTRPDPRHLNDRIVRDADKLWRYEVTGTAVGCDWFGETPTPELRPQRKDPGEIRNRTGPRHGHRRAGRYTSRA